MLSSLNVWTISRKRLFPLPLVVLFLGCAAPAWSKPQTVTVTQCRSAASDLRQVRTEQQAKQMFATMTSGDEIQMSTSFARCVQQHSDVLKADEVALLNLFIYKLDADAMARMWDFIERRKLADAYNDEQEARRVK